MSSSRVGGRPVRSSVTRRRSVALSAGPAGVSPRFVHSADPSAKIDMECTAYIRYVGQGWEIPVDVEIRKYTDADAATLRRRFEEVYAVHFGRAIEGLDAEIISWSLRASSPLHSSQPVTRSKKGKAAAIPVTRDIFDTKEGKYVPGAIVERHALSGGEFVSGPAAIMERETTTIISSAYEAVVQPDGCLLVVSKSA